MDRRRVAKNRDPKQPPDIRDLPRSDRSPPVDRLSHFLFSALRGPVCPKGLGTPMAISNFWASFPGFCENQSGNHRRLPARSQLRPLRLAGGELGRTVVLKGVEEEALLEVALLAGFRFAQGYALSRLLPEDTAGTRPLLTPPRLDSPPSPPSGASREP